jgi:hypothetical protein
MVLARNILGPKGRSVGIRICLYTLILCFLSLFCSISLANELVNLNLHHEVYAFIKRLKAKNLIGNRQYNTQPLMRREATEALIEISEKHLSGQIELTNIEEKHLRRYQWLFGDEIELLRPGLLPPAKKKHTIAVQSENYRVDFDLMAKQEIALARTVSEKQQNTSITSVDFAFSAKLGEHLGIASILHDRILLGSGSYNPYENEVSYELKDESRTLNAMEGYAILDLPWLSLQWGIDDIWWGPGWHGALMISDNSAPKDTLKLSGIYGPLKFTYLTSILREDPPENQPKYMSAHRLEFFPHRGISIGLNEVMIFADRYELRYLNPFIIFYTLQTEDFKNNGLLGVDLDITLIPSVEFYAEVMVDDFQTPEGGDAFRAWNSKYGILTGAYWADPFGVGNTDVRFEYAFVNQYAYTHRYEITRYTHQDFVIGHWMGTDADDVWIDIEHWFTDKLRVSLTYERERQGEGDVRKRHPLDPPELEQTIEPPEYWEFLSGVTESTHSVSLGLSFNSIGRYSAGARYTYSQIRNVENEPGVDGKEHQLLITGDYRF